MKPFFPDFVLDPQLASDSLPVAELALSSLRLMDDANYRWLLLVPRVTGARELVDLGAERQITLMQEIDRVSKLMQALYRPFKLNIAALGNLVPQLHVHLIARYQDDPAWPAPVWGRSHARPYEPDVLASRIADLRRGLGLADAHGERRAAAG